MSKPFQPDEADLAIIRGLRSDQNEEALLKLVSDGFKRPVYAMVINNSGSEDDAKDLYNEMLFVLTKNVKNEDYELNSRLSTYMYAISRNLWLKELKKRKKWKAFDELDNKESMTVDRDDSGWHLYWKIMEECLNGLDNRKDSKCKDLIKMTSLEGESMADVAKLLGFQNDGHARVQKHNCMKRLKKCCENKLKEISHGQ